jgi:phosphopantothenoylcysteine decarboxylase/phosphopantothenate--cysteine ligase
MHTEMWQHQATQANVATLRSRGALIVEPAVGRLTGADSGPGRLPEPDELAELVRRVLARGAVELPLDLTGRHVVVSAGGTREHLDPVRFLGNRSSGRQGYALAATAVARGAEVTLVSANVALPDPAGAKVTRVVSTDDLRAAMLAVAGDADAIVMAAAPADFRPRSTRTTKIKKTGAAPEPIELDVTPDVLVELSSHRSRPGQVVVGFAAETGDETSDALTYARAKLARKGCDLLVVNEVREGRAFESTRNTAVILGADGSRVDIPDGPKEALADVVWDLVIERLPVGNGSD